MSDLSEAIDKAHSDSYLITAMRDDLQTAIDWLNALPSHADDRLIPALSFLEHAVDACGELLPDGDD